MSSSYWDSSNSEVKRVNQIQNDFFNGLIHVFDPPLPEGVPQRLEQIVATAQIKQGECVLDVGSGTGILIPLIDAYTPQAIYACDLSRTMLDHLKEQYPFVHIIAGDVRDIELPTESIDIVFINASYPNIADKKGAFTNIARTMKPQGRLIISHPMGKSFIDLLKERSPFPLDDFPQRQDAETLLEPYGFRIEQFVDESELYFFLARKI